MVVSIRVFGSLLLTSAVRRLVSRLRISGKLNCGAREVGATELEAARHRSVENFARRKVR